MEKEKKRKKKKTIMKIEMSGICSIFYFLFTPNYEPWSWIFVHFKKFDFYCWNKMNHLPINRLWQKFQEICGIIFWPNYHRFWKLILDFCPLKKVFDFILLKKRESTPYKLIMTKVSRNLRIIFFPKYPRFWKFKVIFFR